MSQTSYGVCVCSTVFRRVFECVSCFGSWRPKKRTTNDIHGVWGDFGRGKDGTQTNGKEVLEMIKNETDLGGYENRAEIDVNETKGDQKWSHNR